MHDKIQITKLDPRDEDTIATIAYWYFTEWSTPKKTTKSRLCDYPNSDTLMQAVVFLDGKPLATGGLRNHVNIYREHPKLKAMRPWLALLYTDAGHRGAELGTKLLAYIEGQAKQIGIRKIYLYTFTAEAFYKRNGWTEIDRVTYKKQDTAIMEKKLT